MDVTSYMKAQLANIDKTNGGTDFIAGELMQITSNHAESLGLGVFDELASVPEVLAAAIKANDAEALADIGSFLSKLASQMDVLDEIEQEAQ